MLQERVLSVGSHGHSGGSMFFLCSFKTVPVGLKETLDSVNSGS